MNKENLINFGAQILALDKITRWELDPEDKLLEDYIHEDIINQMWHIFNQELEKIGGINSSIVDYLDYALWEGAQDPDYYKIIEENFKQHGLSIIEYYKPYIELIVENAIKIGAINKRNQRYSKKQG